VWNVSEFCVEGSEIVEFCDEWMKFVREILEIVLESSCFVAENSKKSPESPNFDLFPVKVDRKKQIIVIDEHLEEVSVEELQVSLKTIPPTPPADFLLFQEQLPSHQPRFIVYSYKMIHDDRVSYPMCFIFYTPRDSMVNCLFPVRRFN
jgi:hypothetical protein